MRDFYHTYENQPALLRRAMKLGWIQNVVIMEADLTMELRAWYMKAAKQFGWSKTELIANITANSHEEIVLAIEDEECDAESQDKYFVTIYRVASTMKHRFHHLFQRCRRLCMKEERRRWLIISCPKCTEKLSIFVRC